MTSYQHRSLMKGAFQVLLRLIQGMLIGVGAALPGVSGGVLCVIFGIYHPLMMLLAHPAQAFRTHGRLFLPTLVGSALGFLGIARLLDFLFSQYPAPSTCLLSGLVFGMLPSLLREAGQKGQGTAAWLWLGLGASTMLILWMALHTLRLTLEPSGGWFVFCGFCLALSIIAPGMSFSTLLMPLGLYVPFVSGLAALDVTVLLPGGMGALATIILLSRAMAHWLTTRYTAVMHGILGIVITSAFLMLPLDSFAASLDGCLLNITCIILGLLAACMLERLNQRVPRPELS